MQPAAFNAIQAALKLAQPLLNLSADADGKPLSGRSLRKWTRKKIRHLSAQKNRRELLAAGCL
jgi:hypothetical protein